MNNPFKKNNNFIDLSTTRINPVEHFTIRPTKKKVACALALASMSFIIPDGSIGLVLSTAVLSPLPLSKTLTLKRRQAAAKIIKKWYQLK